MNRHRTLLHKCLKCESPFDMASCVNNETATPKAGDLTVCIYCGHLMAFTPEMDVRALNEDEAAWCRSSGLVKKVEEARREARAKSVQ